MIHLDDDWLIVVDMQNGFVRPETEHVIPNVLRLVERWEALSWPVLFTRFHNMPGSGYEKWIGWTRLRDSDDVALHPEIAPHAHRILDKSVYTAFTSDGIEILQDSPRIVICGIATDSCVLKTAVDAFERDIEPIIPLDACATHGGRDAHEAGALVMRRFVGRGQVVATDDVLKSARLEP